jgi:hypothetical protein
MKARPHGWVDDQRNAIKAPKSLVILVMQNNGRSNAWFRAPSLRRRSSTRYARLIVALLLGAGL